MIIIIIINSHRLFWRSGNFSEFEIPSNPYGTKSVVAGITRIEF
jgi:hypothetical protein